MRAKQQRGFTLAELTVTVAAVGVLGVILNSYVDTGQVLFASSQLVKQERINAQVGDALLEWSFAYDNRLPEPHTNAGNGRLLAPITDAPAAGPETALLNLITSRGVAVNEINDDGRAQQFVRVYQRVEGNTTEVPFFGLSGPLVTLTYDVGVVYHTQCSLFDPCNTTASPADPPGDSPQITLATLDTWTTVGTDTRPIRVNTLTRQQELLRQTASRVNDLRTQLRRFFNALQVASPPGAPDNFFVASDQDGNGVSDRAGIDPNTGNQGCYDGWYDLTDANEGLPILRELGLNPEEFAVTAFGGPIEYCRDYDPGNSSGFEGILPHNAALRMHRSMSEGLAPTNIPGDNIVLSL